MSRIRSEKHIDSKKDLAQRLDEKILKFLHLKVLNKLQRFTYLNKVVL